MATILIPRAEPIVPAPPPAAAIEVLGRVQASTLRHLGDVALFVGGVLDKRGETWIVDHSGDTLTADPSADGPSEVVARHFVSDRATHLFVAVRLQASQAKGADAPELAVRLLAGGVEADKGCAWPAEVLVVENDPERGDFPPFWVTTGDRKSAASDSQTGPRLLNVGDHQSEWVKVEVTADSARVLAVYVCDWPEPAVGETFSA